MSTTSHYINKALDLLRMDNVKRLDISDAIYNLERAIECARSETQDGGWRPFYGYAEAAKVFGGEGQGVGGNEFIFRHNRKTGGIYAMAIPPLPEATHG